MSEKKDSTLHTMCPDNMEFQRALKTVEEEEKWAMLEFARKKKEYDACSQIKWRSIKTRWTK